MTPSSTREGRQPSGPWRRPVCRRPAPRRPPCRRARPTGSGTARPARGGADRPSARPPRCRSTGRGRRRAAARRAPGTSGRRGSPATGLAGSASAASRAARSGCPPTGPASTSGTPAARQARSATSVPFASHIRDSTRTKSARSSRGSGGRSGIGHGERHRTEGLPRAARPAPGRSGSRRRRRRRPGPGRRSRRRSRRCAAGPSAGCAAPGAPAAPARRAPPARRPRGGVCTRSNGTPAAACRWISSTTACACACATPVTSGYGAASRSNRPVGNAATRPSAGSVLSPTVASTTVCPRRRSSVVSVATTFSSPP